MEKNKPLNQSEQSDWTSLMTAHPIKPAGETHEVVSRIDDAAQELGTTTSSLLRAARASACCEVTGGYIQKLRNLGRKCESCPLLPACEDAGII